MKKKTSKVALKKKSDHSEPTTFELATLAATLAEKDSLGNSPEPDLLVSNALNIWTAAGELLEKRRSLQASVSLNPTAPALPVPKRFPVSLDNFLNLLLPHLSGRSGEKHYLFRQYIDSNFAIHLDCYGLPQLRFGQFERPV